jgi:thiamine pyrophosphokinase
MKDFIIVANGDFLVKEIIEEAIANKTIIALDGAAKKLRRLNISPQVVLGDFDSLNQDEIETFAKHSLIVPANDQNLTDLVKAIRYCDNEGATSITIICASGGQLDHHEGAMRALRTEYKKNRLILLHTDQQTVRFAKDETVTLQGRIGDRCGIIAFPQGSFSSMGLRYDVKNMLLTFGFSDSTCNSLVQDKAVVTVSGEALLVMPPQLQSQRDYISKSDIERLEMQLRDAKR